MIVYAEGATKWMYDMGEDIVELLNLVYPGHPWGVNVYGDKTGGGYFIRHLDFPKNWGINQPRAHMFASASELRADVIRKGGELLERINKSRSLEWDEVPIRKMDGVPDKDQPIEYQREVGLAKAVAVVEEQLKKEANTAHEQVAGST